MSPNEIESMKDVPPPIPAFSLRGSLSPLLLVPSLIPALMVFFAPVDVLDRFPLLVYFTGWMSAHVPYMNMHAQSTIFPQVALLVNCMVIALVPYVAMVVFFQSWMNYPYLLQRRKALGRADLKQHFLIFVGAPLSIGAIAAMVMLPGDPSWARGTTTHHRGYFYAFLVFFMPLMAGYAVGGQFLNFRLFVDTYLYKEEIK